MKMTIAGAAMIADCAGAVYWPEQQLLALADLHLEKGSSFAARGVFLPPYDTAATLERIARLVDHYAPRVVLALGDSFHDGNGPARIAAADRATLTAIQRGREWIWITGNHDPLPAPRVGGSFTEKLVVDALIFRHQPTGVAGEVAGHLHPVARVAARGRTVIRRCFASDGTRLVMPAFGAYAGSLNVRHRAFADVFGTLAYTAHLLGEGRLYAMSASRCLCD